MGATPAYPLTKHNGERTSGQHCWRLVKEGPVPEFQRDQREDFLRVAVAGFVPRQQIANGGAGEIASVESPAITQNVIHPVPYILAQP